MGIKGDITGGLTAGVIALPLCLAFGIASGMGAAAGLYGAMILSFYAGVFGGTRTQISGPTGPMTVVAASVVLAFKGDAAMIASVFALAGILQITFGVFKVGKFIQFIPYPVISGFMNGVGVIIILLQISPLLGGVSSSTTIDAILSLFSIDFNLQSAILGVLALGIIYLSPKKLNSIIPSPLLALILLSIFAFYLKLDVATIGQIPSGLPKFIMPNLNFSMLSLMFGYAFILALLGSIDSLLTSLVADSLTKTKHNSNKELIGQGVGNFLVGLFGGLVGAGATMRTVTNIKLGGNSRLSSIISSLFLLAVLIVLGGYVGHVPIAVLSGILIKVGLDILDHRLLKELKLAPKGDLFVMILVFLLTVFVDLILAVSVGVLFASLKLIYQINKLTKIEIKQESDLAQISVNGAFYFGTSFKVANVINSLNSLKLIINLQETKFIDLSGIYSLQDEIQTAIKSKKAVALVVRDDADFGALVGIFGKDGVFYNFEDAKKWIKEL